MAERPTDGGRPVEIVPGIDVAAARQRLDAAAARTTSTVTYASAGHVLVVGEPAAALAVGARLVAAGATGVTVVHVVPEATRLDKALTEDGVAVFTVPALGLDGHLGAFVAVALAGGVETDLAVSVQRPGARFDLVLDLSAEPLVPLRLPPPGYAHVPRATTSRSAGDGVEEAAPEDERRAATSPATDAEGAAPLDDAALAEAIETLGGLVGEFDKPRYFAYDASICAHSRSRLPGCSNCIEVCVAGAISSAGEGVAVDPYRCQGCGSCATRCPTGAMVYAYPKPSDAIARSRKALAEGEATTLVLHDEGARAALEAAALPDDVLALLVEEVSAFGIDYWATVLCAGVGRVLVVTDAAADNPNRAALEEQATLLRRLVAGLGIGEEVVQLVPSAALAELDTLPGPVAALTELVPPGPGAVAGAPGTRPSAFTVNDDKRGTLRLALEALDAALAERVVAETGTAPAPIEPLPPGAPFGHVVVDTDACTLCMACVSTCPAGALLDGQDTPALRLVEANCVQCGLCEQACPERAIRPEPRFVRDGVEARRVRTLHAEAPFHCVVCHKPFATRAIIDTMLGKLAGHWMFRDDKARRRLKMCEDCRVKDIFRDDPAGFDVHGKPGAGGDDGER